MLETKSYIEILETNIPNVSRNHQSKVTDWDWNWRKSKLDEEERESGVQLFWESKLSFLKISNIADFILVFSR